MSFVVGKRTTCCLYHETHFSYIILVSSVLMVHVFLSYDVASLEWNINLNSHVVHYTQNVDILVALDSDIFIFYRMDSFL